MRNVQRRDADAELKAKLLWVMASGEPVKYGIKQPSVVL